MYVVCIDEENGQDTVCTSVNVIYNKYNLACREFTYYGTWCK